MGREAKVDRVTKETEIHIQLKLDGKGLAQIRTRIPFMDHMLFLFSRHGFFDLRVEAEGDIDVDYHHTIEDLGICLGMAIGEALKNKGGVRRYGQAFVPMDESLARVVLDLCNRPYLFYRVSLEKTVTGEFDIGLVKEFFRALITHAGMTLHVDLLRGDDPHHVSEAIFKAFGVALDQACMVESRLKGEVPSTKGVL
jgi:imidazoleglycerol-phosphate dehydratase